MIRYILGVDVGASCGLALLEQDGQRFRYVNSETTRTPFQSALFSPLPDVLAVEGVSGAVYRDGGDIAGALGRGKHLMAAARLSGRFEQYAIGHHLDWYEHTARTVRAAMCGAANADDARVKLAVCARVTGWPRTDAHQRDAALVAMFVGLSLELPTRAAIGGAT